MGVWNAFVAALDAPVSEGEDELVRIVSAAIAAHPRFGMSPPDFASFLGAKVSGSADPIREVAARNVSDLALVFAVDRKATGADAAFDEVLKRAATRVHRTVNTGLTLDELLQELRVHVLVGRDDGEPRLRSFAGKSSLERWLHVVGTRHAFNLCRNVRRELPFEDAFFLSQPDLSTPEAKLLVASYGAPVRNAVSLAIARVGERERAILWLSLVDGQPAERIGQIYGVHRTTAARWIEKAIDHLRVEVENELTRAGIAESQLSSIVRSLLVRGISSI